MALAAKAKAKKIDQMTAEELNEEEKKQDKAAKVAADKKAAIVLRRGTQGIIDIVKSLRIPELFKKIRVEKKDDTIEDIAILAAIAEAAGAKDVVITKVVKKTSAGKGGATGTRKSYTDEFKANAVKMVADGKKKSVVAKELGVGVGSVNKWVETAENK